MWRNGWLPWVMKPVATVCALAERAVWHSALGSCSCRVPLAAFATLDGEQLNLRRGWWLNPMVLPCYRAQISGPADQAEDLGLSLAEDLKQQGAQAILDRLLMEQPQEGQ